MSDGASHSTGPRPRVSGQVGTVRSSSGSHRTIEDPARNAGWRSGDVVRATLLAVAVVAACVGLWAASTIVFTVFLGVLFGLAISSGVDRLARLHIPRAAGALIVVLGVAGVLALIGALLAPTISEQASEIQSRLPEAIHQAERWVSREERTSLRTITGHAPSAPQSRNDGQPGHDSTVNVQGPGAGGGTAAAPNVANQVTSGLAGVAGHLFGFVGSTLQIFVFLLLILFLAVYIASDPELYHRGLMHLFPHYARARAGQVLTHMSSVLRQWLLTQLIAMITLGVVWAIALSLLGVKAAFALAVIAGLLEFVPTIGPTMAVLPALAMALLDSPTKALSVLGVYLVIQGLEANVLIPLLMQGRMDLPPALTIVAQALMTFAFGFLGLMIAVPLLATVMIPIKLLYVEGVVGDQVMEEEEQQAPAG
jgi:predicted PurR-regulated permease PerM